MQTMERAKCAVLPLVLKSKWYDLIESGVKKEEYRDTKEYYETRLRNWHRKMWPGFAVVEFRRGYAKSASRMAFFAMRIDSGDPYERFHYEIRRRCLHPDWGEPNDWHYVIKLGERVELTEERM